MFADGWLNDLAPDRAEAVLRAASLAVRPRLESDGVVWADYRRLRFEAVCR